ncbi:hypothetical protein Tco_1069168 [Tanacetum coccineum]|uniref:Uncharacterized protein n=1 Tax=Tanacetum coccineum TaxID=301880 RepID=A0ABQ5HHS8_9ASTR
MESVKKLIDKRALHKRDYDSRVNERQMQTTEEKVDTSKALDASLVNTESSGTKFEKQDTNSRSGNDADADDSDIKPVYDKEPMAEVQLTAECNVFAIGQQHSEQPKFNNKGEVDHNVEQCHGIRREDVREVFQQRGSGAKRKLSRCGRNQMGNEPILALPEGADDFVVYYDARSKDLEACLEKGEGDCLYVATTEEAYTTKYSIHPGADTMLCGFRLTNRWLSMKKDIASCGSKYLAYSEVEVEYQGSSGLLLQPELPE